MDDRTYLLHDPFGDFIFRYTYAQGLPGDPEISGNVNVTQDGWCYGQIKSDPDVAGLGVGDLASVFGQRLGFGTVLRTH